MPFLQFLVVDFVDKLSCVDLMLISIINQSQKSKILDPFQIICNKAVKKKTCMCFCDHIYEGLDKNSNNNLTLKQKFVSELLDRATFASCLLAFSLFLFLSFLPFCLSFLISMSLCISLVS